MVRWAFWIFVCVAPLLAGEVFVRVADARRGVQHADYVLPPKAFFRYQHHPFLGYVLRPGRAFGQDDPSVRIDASGFRSDAPVAREKPPGVVRIVALGGSTTFDGKHAEASTYPGILERLLSQAYPDRDFEVINAGVPGWTTLENVMNLHLRLLEFAPDYVVYYGGANNARANLTHGEEFRSDHTHFRRSFPEDAWFERHAAWWNRLLEQSRLFVFLRKSFTDFDERRFIHWYIFSIPGDQLAKSEKISEAGLRSFENDLRSLVSIARAHGIAPVLATFAWKSGVAGEAGGVLEECMRRQNEIRRRVASENGVALADVEQQFQAGADGFTDAVHLTEQGNREIARIVAQALRPQLDRSPSRASE